MIAPAGESRNAVRSGAGRLVVQLVAGQSAVTSSQASSPLKILVPRPRGPSVWACLSSFGGGLVAGDETSLSVELGDQARCFLGTQASTKVYRNPEHKPCGHRLEATLGRGAILACAPDPVQPFAGSTYCQRQEFHLGPESGLALVDRLSCGRAALGERWAFRHFQSRVEVYQEGERVLVESLLFDQDSGPLAAPHRAGRFNSLALVLVLGAPFQAAATRLLEQTAAEPVPRRGGFLRAASPARGGALLRYAGVDAEEVGTAVRRDLDFLPGFLEDDPWRRKW